MPEQRHTLDTLEYFDSKLQNKMREISYSPSKKHFATNLSESYLNLTPAVNRQPGFRREDS